MGPTIESRFANGIPNGAPSGTPVSWTASNGSGIPQPKNKNKWLTITIVLTALEIVTLIVLFIVILGQDNKVCTYEDVLETIRNESSPSENRKLIDDFMFDDQGEALKIYAEAMANKSLSNEGIDEVKKWSEKYTNKFGGDALGETVRIKKIETFLATGGEERAWRLLLETDGGCARYDFTTDFQFLDIYTLTAGSCDGFIE